MSFKKSSKTHQAAGSRALLDGPLRREPAAGGAGSPLLALESALRKPARSVDRTAPAHAGAGSDARAVRLSALARDDAPGRLGGRQATVRSGGYRGRARAATPTTVAPCDGGPSRATAAGSSPQRDLEHGLRRRPTRRRATIPSVDGDRSVHARVSGDRHRPGAQWTGCRGDT